MEYTRHQTLPLVILMFFFDMITEVCEAVVTINVQLEECLSCGYKVVRKCLKLPLLYFVTRGWYYSGCRLHRSYPRSRNRKLISCSPPSPPHPFFCPNLSWNVFTCLQAWNSILIKRLLTVFFLLMFTFLSPLRFLVSVFLVSFPSYLSSYFFSVSPLSSDRKVIMFGSKIYSIVLHH